MLINKWLITDTINGYNPEKNEVGVCLYVPGEPTDINKLYQSIQSLIADNSLALFFSGKDFDSIQEVDSYITKLLGIFFLPSYCLVNYQPLVFIQYSTSAAAGFLDQLNQKCIRQGIRGILVKEVSSHNSTASEEFTWLLNEGNFDLKSEIKRWTDENAKGNSPSAINLLVPAGKENILNNLAAIQNELKEKEEYKIADALYQKQQLLDETNHQLYLKTINVKNLRFYLSMQKKERTDSLKWYYYEYEILPTWFKQIGHIIKVIMGKRSFKSLFNDNVKKYKD